MIPNPRFDQHLREQAHLDSAGRNLGGRSGIVQSYNPQNNTATVLLSDRTSDVAGELITNVMCPIIMGIQTVAPEPGRPCWVVFDGTTNDKRAVISHYFNHRFDRYDYGKQYLARSAIPRYRLGL